jgi:formylglycine-generating enzyme required for sulfatase activity
MGKYEVTQTEYERLIGQNPSSFSRQGKAKDDVSGQNTEQFPVDRTSWDDAIEFSRKLTDQERKSGRLPTGWGYTLPTESQWEYACRAETTTVFSFGNQLNGREANCDGTHPYGTDSNGPYLKRTTRVGSYRGNNWGLCDMHGNVYEWCQDWYGTKLLGGNDPAGPSAGSSRVIRGGGWFDVAVTCRSAYRNRYSPSLRRGDIGFRVVLSP